MALLFRPEKLGFSVSVDDTPNAGNCDAVITKLVAATLSFPVLSYALIKYVPDKAGRAALVAGLAIFSIPIGSKLELSHVAPDVKELCLT